MTGSDRRAFGAGMLALFAVKGARADGRPEQLAATLDAWSHIWPPTEVIPLWPHTPPGKIAGAEAPELPRGWTDGAWPPSYLRRTAMPTLNVFRPAHPNGEALLVCPGGAYVFVSAANEGVDVARLFTAFGTTVFVLSYRLPGEGWADRANVPLQDAQRAMRLIRARARTWGIRPDRLGVLGFSAGGHLAATLAVDHAEPVYRAVDASDRESARPAYAGLIYPVIQMNGTHVHARSRDELLGAVASTQLAAHRSPDLRVSSATPPCFLAHAADDTSVSIENSLAMFAALQKNRVRCEAHFFTEGQHAFGIGRRGQPSEMWPALFDRWVRAQTIADS
jgi:acetyl esterase/lipase